MTHTYSHVRSIVLGAALFTVALGAIASMPLSAFAASYAYVDVAGTVRSVTANTWQSAISVAPNIHPRSGVMLLETAGDLQMIGDSI